jgi:hypothetical protein
LCDEDGDSGESDLEEDEDEAEDEEMAEDDDDLDDDDDDLDDDDDDDDDDVDDDDEYDYGGSVGEQHYFAQYPPPWKVTKVSQVPQVLQAS